MHRFRQSKITTFVATLLFTIMSLFWLFALAGSVFQDEEQLNFFVSFLSSSSPAEYSLNLVGPNFSTPITEVIANGNFADGFNHWQYRGDISLKTESENQYLQMGTSTSSNLVSENCISQTIDSAETTIFLSFSYQLFSNETDPLFDTASLMVLLDGQPIYIAPAINLITTWQDEIIRLENLTPGEHQLQICAGNSGDREASTWAYLDNVTTQALALTAADSVRLMLPSGFTAQVSYVTETSEEILVSASQSFSFNQPLVDNLLTIKLTNLATLENFLLPVKLFFIDETPGPVSDLQVLSCDLTTCLLEFSDDQFRLNNYFVIKTSEELLTEFNWALAQTLNTIQFFDEMKLWQPTCFNDRCWLMVILPESTTNYLGLKVCNVAGNCSALSNIVDQTDLDQEQIIINEVMFNAVGSDSGEWEAGEWLEFYNTSLLPIDVNQWTLTDAVNNTRILSTSNCDTNHNFFDSGETIVPPKSYLVMYLHGSPMLNNTGDTIILKNDCGSIVNELIYPGSSVENKTYARIPDASDTWQPRIPPTPLAPNSL